MDRQSHWNHVYQTKSPTEVSWFEAEPRISLELIDSVASVNSRVIDVGGGASRLVDCLLDAGYGQVAVLDVSAAALETARVRLGDRASRAQWIVADIVECDSLGQFDVWHDRAVFHFLTEAAERRKYVDLAARTVPAGGHVILGTFALEGPEKCSGLNVRRYDAASLASELGPRFTLVRELSHTHTTPTQKTQAFIFCVFQRSSD
jgi:SAM-dependent methyltransferase